MTETTDKCTRYRFCETSEDGFTLIEVLIAIAIMAIGLLAIGSMQIGAMQGTDTARSNTELVAIASEQMERLTGLPYNHDDLDEGSHNRSNFHDARFSVEWVIEEWDTNPVDLGLKTITLTASEQRFLRGVTRTLTLQNVIPRVN